MTRPASTSATSTSTTSSNDTGVPRRGTLIIGNCQAGVQLASSLRDLGDTEPIVLVGEESHAPYQRPPLSKAFLKGEVTADSLTFRTHEFYADHQIELVTRERIVEIERDAHGGVAVAESGRRFGFARLALTTGAVPRQIPFEGSELEGVSYLRTATDAALLEQGLLTATDVVVVGGGFIGLEVAAGARAAGKTVTVLEAAPRLVGRAVSEETSAFYLAAHTRRGTRVVLNAQVARFTGEHDRVTGVELADGSIIPADVVLIGVGVIPRTELAAQLGLDLDNGITVNSGALTSDGLTVAAGDCANLPNPSITAGGIERLRLESVQNAVEQAKIAAATLLGLPAEYSTVPWFWSDQADLKLQIAGLSGGHDRIVLRGDPDSEKFSVLYYRGGQIIAADCVNRPLDFIAVRSALHKGQQIDPDAAVDETMPLKKLVTDAPTPVLAAPAA
ncbi:NAD(P)/FAD-dependent oxidoreductase [Cryobacterium psychrophilum]|uniref:Ferredoxin n=1 Tax=Cryobacterium psychrophilum TaxID=41988 RepID=A0A4Y8KPQ0_9MICO|nr:FAD-dependent oxidoreductase [Cryobacterium psychrophilum]TDW31596.1 3-phenylpropionate/trans-cinnamate dioxygenase ferredoxin reductase subunit [Cryobacterium psychrophilum]TFD75175.1 ferredoxin [Cryobacterium psychrophilum]